MLHGLSDGFFLELSDSLADIAQDVPFQSGELEPLKCAYHKELQGEEYDVRIIARASSVIRSAGKRIWLAHRLSRFMVEREVEVREV